MKSPKHKIQWKNLLHFKRKSNSFETDDGKEVVKNYNDFLKMKMNRKHSRDTSKKAAFAEKWNRTNKNPLEKSAFERKVLLVG